MKIFERETVRIGNLGVIVSFCSLLAACVAVYFVYQQFKEMSAQTKLLSQSSEQTAKDSAATEASTTKQLAIAQRSLDAIQGQLKEARRSADYARQSITNAQKALDASIAMSEKQDALMTEQVEAVQNQTELAERPWIAISDPKVDQPWQISNSGEMSGSIQLTIRNIGKTPAKGTIVHLEFAGFLFNGEFEPKLIRKLCTTRWPDVGDYEWGQILFPTEPLAPGVNWGIAGKATQPSPADPNEHIFPESIVGCVQYKSLDARKSYYTGFVYHLTFWSNPTGVIQGVNFDPKDGNAINVPTGFINQGNQIQIPKESVQLSPAFVFGAVAK
jgi:hypothetical protein